jgi:hypothetical protein
VSDEDLIHLLRGLVLGATALALLGLDWLRAARAERERRELALCREVRRAMTNGSGRAAARGDGR